MFEHYENVRFLDMNAGKHLSNERLQGFLTEANQAYLASKGMALDNVNGATLVVSQVNIKFIKEVKYPDTLKIVMASQGFKGPKLSLHYEIFSQTGVKTHDCEMTCLLVDNKNKNITKPTADIQKIFN